MFYIDKIIIGAIAFVVGAILFFIFGMLYRKKVSEKIIGSAETESDRIIAQAKKTAEDKKRESLLSLKEEVYKTKLDIEREARDRRNEVQKSERRLQQRMESFDKKSEALEAREELLSHKEKEVDELNKQMENVLEEKTKELEKISELSREDARAYLLDIVEKDLTHDSAVKIKEFESKTKEDADRIARNIISLAIQKTAADHVSESTVSVVAIPNEEMKGRIIGREGRNIRTLETLTGIDLIIDDTPEAVVLSGFDPIRREIARRSLEKLIQDGRIHPARIEEMVEKSTKEVENIIRQEGDRVTFEVGVHGLHPELVKLIGRLKFRTSYGQNILNHSVEVAHLTGIMAAELGLDVSLAKRAGLLHDIGKAVDYEMEGSHSTIGADLARKYKEGPEVVNAILSHHGDVEPTSTIAVLVQAADSISAARPGARRETLESYVKRIEKIEEIANSFDGVEKTYAIQAGREVRIIVKPEAVSDDEITIKAREVVKKIEDEMEYPGQIKVNVIRETRAIEYAK